ncbi:MAG: RNA ligase family protein, partial [Bacillota bacterium]|nr:RNA ligase family protein [Bacillota bacterium]
MLNDIIKYPRTNHIEGSRFQTGDENLDSIPFKNIANRFLVIEEKIDGANSGISFSDDGEMLLQSRGHYLTGGGREKHFKLFKTWANAHSSELF